MGRSVIYGKLNFPNRCQKKKRKKFIAAPARLIPGTLLLRPTARDTLVLLSTAQEAKPVASSPPSVPFRSGRAIHSGSRLGSPLDSPYSANSSDGAAAAVLLLDVLLATDRADAPVAALLRLVAAAAPTPRADATALQRRGLRGRGRGPGTGAGRRRGLGGDRVPDGGAGRRGREREAQADANIAGEQG
jgi:hypothetical protein